jgi:hypothetical protein
MSHKGTILIIAYECYPYNRTGSSIGAQRPYQFAKNLSELGWKAIVLCCDIEKRRILPKENLEEASIALFNSYRERMNKEECCVIPLPSLKSHGWADYLWAASVNKGPGDTYIGKGFPFSFIRKFATVYNQLLHGDYSWSWTPVAESFAQQLIKEQKIDVIIGEHSPDAGILLADKFSRQYNIPWIADFRDPVLWPFKGLFGSLYKQVVKRVVRSAEATVNVNPYWSELDKHLFGKPTHTIINGYDKDYFAELPAYQFPFFAVSYFGSFNETFQDIRPSLISFAEFLKRNHEPSDVRLFYRGLQHQEFLKHCYEAGIPSDHLDVQDFVKREETISFMKGSAVLLLYSVAVYKVNNIYEKKGLYPGKVFEYIGTHRPVLCIPSDNGLLEALIQTVKMGNVTSSCEEAAIFLQQQYEKWKIKKDIEPLFLEHAEDYTRQKQALELEAILWKIIQARGE